MPAVAYFDRCGRLVSRAAWKHLIARQGYGDVAADVVAIAGRVAHVDTFWVGITHLKRPLLFRTVVPRPGGPTLTWGWASEADAKAGHRAVCAWLAATGAMPAGVSVTVDRCGAS
jgi:hypothetical protein